MGACTPTPFSRYLHFLQTPITSNYNRFSQIQFHHPNFNSALYSIFEPETLTPHQGFPSPIFPITGNAVIRIRVAPIGISSTSSSGVSVRTGLSCNSPTKPSGP